jgi:hypothetical protein
VLGGQATAPATSQKHSTPTSAPEGTPSALGLSSPWRAVTDTPGGMTFSLNSDTRLTLGPRSEFPHPAPLRRGEGPQSVRRQRPRDGAGDVSVAVAAADLTRGGSGTYFWPDGPTPPTRPNDAPFLATQRGPSGPSVT